MRDSTTQHKTNSVHYTTRCRPVLELGEREASNVGAPLERRWVNEALRICMGASEPRVQTSRSTVFDRVIIKVDFFSNFVVP